MIKRLRKSNIELLRILSMFLIIGYHLSFHMQWHPHSENPINNTILSLFSIVFGSWGILGVDVFVIISAFYLVDKQFKSERILKIIYVTALYIFVFIGIVTINEILSTGFSGGLKFLILLLVDEILQPLFCNDYWYISAYIILCLLTPWLNKFINSTSEKVTKKTVIVLLFIPFCSNFFIGTPIVANVANFVFIYILIGYLKKWKMEKVINSKLVFWGSFIIPLIIIVSVVLEWKLPHKGFLGMIRNFIPYSFGNINRHSAIILLAAICLFFSFYNLKISNNQIINSVASSVLGIYLFHESQIFNITNILGNRFLSDYSYSNIPIAMLLFFGIVILIFVLGMATELIRQQIFDKQIYNKIIARKLRPFCNRIDNWFSL